jgi:hypothetical protein
VNKYPNLEEKENKKREMRRRRAYGPLHHQQVDGQKVDRAAKKKNRR